MKPKLRVWVTFGEHLKFGDGRAQLLELIEERGSLKKAAQELEMSYRNAWGYLRDLEEAAGFKFVATGHGPVGTVKDITAWREYFETLESAVAAGLAAGQTLEQMQQNIKMSEYSQWEGFDWVPLNVLAMYHFLTDTP